MKRVTAICPGSCGELIQGQLGGKKVLVSYPVSLYSKVTLELGRTREGRAYPKIWTALKSALEYLEIPLDYLENLNIEVARELPIGKGMASSTADIGAAILAGAALFDKTLTSREMSRIAVEVEPSDSILFPNLTLFDYLEGTVVEELGPCPSLEVVVLEGYGVVDTLEFNRAIPLANTYSGRQRMTEAYELLKKGLQHQNMGMLGQAALISSRLNQDILPKTFLERVIEEALGMEALGVNIAHSGTVMGVILDPVQCDRDRVFANFSGPQWESYFEKVYLTHMVSGSPCIVDTSWKGRTA